MIKSNAKIPNMYKSRCFIYCKMCTDRNYKQDQLVTMEALNASQQSQTVTYHPGSGSSGTYASDKNFKYYSYWDLVNFDTILLYRTYSISPCKTHMHSIQQRAPLHQRQVKNIIHRMHFCFCLQKARAYYISSTRKV